MFEKLRQLGSTIQAKYENLISTKSLYGFSDAYAQAMMQIKERNHKEAS